MSLPEISGTAPFIHTEKTTKYMYFCFLIALVPPVVFSVFYYGLRAVILFLFCAFLSSLIQGFKDYSAPVHGIVLALMLPADASLISAAVGVLLSELVIKNMFGGPGSNIVYPSVFSRLMLEIIFPSDMKVTGEPGADWFALKSLVTLGSNGQRTAAGFSYSTSEIIAGRFSSYMGMGCFLLLILAFIFICRSKIAKVSAPGFYLITVFAVRMLLNTSGSVRDILIYMMTSGVVFVAVYILTDPGTTAQYGSASVLEGVLCGLITGLLSIRLSGIVSLLVPVIFTELMDGAIRFFCGIADKWKLEAKSK